MFKGSIYSKEGITAVTGPNGSGKTIFPLITGILKPTKAQSRSVDKPGIDPVLNGSKIGYVFKIPANSCL